MTTKLAHYHSRHPRYILLPQDNTLIRVAGPRQTPWEESTEVQNISLTGLAFTAPPELCPIVGEFIKIQFHLPGNISGPLSGSMACHGLVTRLETLKESQILVGVQFKKLEPAQRLALAQALAIQLKEQLAQAQKRAKPKIVDVVRALWQQKRKALLAAGFFLVVWCGLFYVLSTILSSN